MTVDFVFEMLNSLFPNFAGNEIFLIFAMLLPFFALFGIFVTTTPLVCGIFDLFNIWCIFRLI